MKKYTFLMLIVLMISPLLYAQNPPPSRPRLIDWPTVAQYVKAWMAINGLPIDPNGTIGTGKSVRIATNGSNNQTLASDGNEGTKWTSGGGGYTNLTSFVDQTASRFFGSDASGDVKERTAAQMLSDLGFEADPSDYLTNTTQFPKGIVISNPAAGSVACIRMTSVCTIKAVHVLCIGGTNWVGHLDECDANGANPVAVDSSDITATAGTNANDDGSLSNSSIDAGDYIGVTTTSVSGSPTRILITFDYTMP